MQRSHNSEKIKKESPSGEMKETMDLPAVGFKTAIVSVINMFKHAKCIHEHDEEENLKWNFLR